MERENEQNTSSEKQFITFIPLCLLNTLFKGKPEKYCNWQEMQLNELLFQHRPQRGPPCFTYLGTRLDGICFAFSSIGAG